MSQDRQISSDSGALEHAQERPACPLPKVARRLGAAAFLFFLIKGLVWLAVFAFGALGLMNF